MAHLTHTLFINTSVDDLNAIVKDPYQWPKFMTGMSEPQRVFGDGGPGTKMEYSITMLGVAMHMVQRTAEERHNQDGSTDWRWEIEGYTPGWVACHHEPKEGGTQITTDFEYSLPGSVLGMAADRLLFERRMRRDFENSLENLKLLAEIGVSMPQAASA